MVLLHQNMYRWGGGNPRRDFRPAFRQIALGNGPIAIAGLTEVTNDRASVAAVGEALGPAGLGLVDLAQGDGFVAVVNCGASALGMYEYIAIGVSDALEVAHLGRVYRSATLGRMVVDRSPDPFWQQAEFDAWTHSLPPGASLDYRCIVYATVGDGVGPNFSVGFLHNIYRQEDNRAAQMLGLQDVFAHIPTRPFFLGGDFNVPPAPRGTAHRRVYVYAAGVPTTLGGNEYDYWHGSVPPQPAGPTPRVCADTQHPNLSDHKATLLVI